MKAASKAAPPRRREEARVLFRNAILDAAEAVFAEHGFHSARIQDIAKHARIAVGTVYNHFDEKEDLLRALVEERTGAMIRELERRPEDPRDFAAALTARIERFLRVVGRHHSFFVVAMEHGLAGTPSAESRAVLTGKPARMLTRIRGAFRVVVEEGVRDGALLADDLDDLAALLGSTLRGLVLERLAQGEDVVAQAPRIVRFFLRGAGAPSGAPHKTKSPAHSGIRRRA